MYYLYMKIYKITMIAILNKNINYFAKHAFSIRALDQATPLPLILCKTLAKYS